MNAIYFKSNKILKNLIRIIITIKLKSKLSKIILSFCPWFRQMHIQSDHTIKTTISDSKIAKRIYKIQYVGWIAHNNILFSFNEFRKRKLLIHLRIFTVLSLMRYNHYIQICEFGWAKHRQVPEKNMRQT